MFEISRVSNGGVTYEFLTTQPIPELLKLNKIAKKIVDRERQEIKSAG